MLSFIFAHAQHVTCSKWACELGVLSSTRVSLCSIVTSVIAAQAGGQGRETAGQQERAPEMEGKPAADEAPAETPTSASLMSVAWIWFASAMLPERVVLLDQMIVTCLCSPEYPTLTELSAANAIS